MDNYFISARELNALRRDRGFYRSYYLLDIRDKAEFSSGCIPGAVNIPQDELSGHLWEIPSDKRVIVYCKQGISSKEAANSLRENGYTVVELHGGYSAWLSVAMEENISM